jgi:hypothetical protein
MPETVEAEFGLVHSVSFNDKCVCWHLHSRLFDISSIEHRWNLTDALAITRRSWMFV